MEKTTDTGIGAGVRWRLLLAAIGVCLALVYDIVYLTVGIGLVPLASLAQPGMLLEITVNTAIVLLGLGFHALYLEYGRALCKIAFFAFILTPLFFLLRMVPALIPYGIWVYLVPNLAIPLLGAGAFFNLRSEGKALFVLTSIIVILGALMDWLSYALSGGLFFILPLELGMTVRSVGRILMWVFMAAAFAWVYKNRPSLQ